MLKRSLIHIFLALLITSFARADGMQCRQLFDSVKISTIKASDIEIAGSFADLAKESIHGAIMTSRDSQLLIGNIDYTTRFSLPLRLSADIIESWQLSHYVDRQSKINPKHTSLSENLQNTNHPYLKNPLTSTVAYQYRACLLDPIAIFKFASLNFFAASRNSPGNFVMYIETAITRKLSAKYGRRVVYEREFAVGKKMDWVSLRFSDFVLSESNLTKKYPLHLVPQAEISFGFEVPAGKGKNLAELHIKKDISFTLDIPRKNIHEFIDNIFLNHESLFYAERFGSRPDDGVIKDALKDFFTNMAIPENQLAAVQIAKQGRAAINAELVKYGWSTQTEFTGKVTMLDVVERLYARDLFSEGSSFGKTHGRFAHHAQILAGLNNLPKYKADLVLDFIAFYIGDVNRSNQWPIWNPLFDSRGYDINSNRYWRDLLYAE